MDAYRTELVDHETAQRRTGWWLVRRSLALVAGAGALVLLRSAHARVVAPVSVSLAVDRPQIEIYGMAGCPYTRAFIEGPMTEVLSILPDQFDLRFVPFGNSYYITEACGGSMDGMKFAAANAKYNGSGRECWDAHCGSAAQHPDEDCFQGPLVCQHGISDGMVTTAWNCAKDMAKDDVHRYWPFVTCTAFSYLAITNEDKYDTLVKTCAKSAKLDAEELLQCSRGARGKTLLAAAGRATKGHAGVPYVLVDGAQVDDTGCVGCGDGVINKLCDALRSRGAEETAVCKWLNVPR